MDVQQYRRDFPIVKRYNFLDHANMAPSPVQVVQAVTRLMNEKASDAYMMWDRWRRQIDQARENIAKIIGATKEGIWFVNNATDGVNIVANSIDWQPGDNVVMSDIEFPSVVYPFLRKRGRIEVRYAPSRISDGEGASVPIDGYERLVNDRTKVVCVSTVDFAFGIKHDLRRIAGIAHSHGAIVLADGSQSAGAYPMDVAADGVDVLTLGGQKWMLAPSAGGIFYMDPRLYATYQPPNIGWMSVESPLDQLRSDYTKGFELAKDATRFATGHLNYPGIIGLWAASNYLLRVRMEMIESRIMDLTTALMDGLDELGLPLLTPKPRDSRAGIVSFQVEEPDDLIGKLRTSRIVVSGAIQTKGRGLRVSPHFYNTKAEVEELVEAIGKILRKKRGTRRKGTTV
jgi:selenocysteine lyase/cysteine desulfurase